MLSSVFGGGAAPDGAAPDAASDDTNAASGGGAESSSKGGAANNASGAATGNAAEAGDSESAAPRRPPPTRKERNRAWKGTLHRPTNDHSQTISAVTGTVGCCFFLPLTIINLALWARGVDLKCDQPIVTWFVGNALLSLCMWLYMLYISYTVQYSTRTVRQPKQREGAAPSGQTENDAGGDGGLQEQLASAGVFAAILLFGIMAVWYFAGNLWVWNTEGCDTDYVSAAQGFMIFSYVVAFLLFCCVCLPGGTYASLMYVQEMQGSQVSNKGSRKGVRTRVKPPEGAAQI